MRFLPSGPSIPDELLEERDKGNVVFFCGAGVSRSAGLPDFLGLAAQVIDRLGAPRNSKSRVLLDRATQDPDFAPPLDQLFNALQQEYGAGIVDHAVSDLLKTPRNANTDQHSIVLRLSCNAAGRPQIVTTNFDLLFERTDKTIKTHVPPALPDLVTGQPIEGVVYLHGRRASNTFNVTDRQGLILSSADFGRAYLAEGWATTFVRELLRSYVIVLLGYSANDPPVRYLLEGLHSLGSDRSARIFAFDRGPANEVQDRWGGRGVHPLAYSEMETGHAGLWDTLRSWADRARDPDAWRRSVIDMTQCDPKKLHAYQRGQVASLLRTVSGATLFADADPPPSVEWLCVFDRYVRYGEARKGVGGDQTFDPLMHYGLDDDPPRPAKTGPATIPTGDDLISLLPCDELTDNPKRLAGVPSRWADPLPPRIFQLVRWICRCLNQPAAAWWVAGYQTLHPSLAQQIEWQLEHSHGELDRSAYNVWTLLLEKWRCGPDDEDSWYHFAPSLKREGWAPKVLRDLERLTQPYLASKRPWGQQSHPPEGSWEGLNSDDVVHFEVKFPARELGGLTVPPEKLPDVFRILRRSLEHAADLLAEVGTRYWRTATLHPEDKPGERHLREADHYLINFVGLFDRLCIENPELARAEVRRWRVSDEFFFDKLKIYAWMKPDLISANEANSGLLGLSDHAFWESHHHRELLHTLRARWNEFSDDARRRMEQRIIGGPSQWPSEDELAFQKRKGHYAATTLGWLQQQGCQLSAVALQVLPKLRDADPDWRPSWDTSADHSYEGRGGAVRVEPDPSKILEAPLSEILNFAKQETKHSHDDFVEYRPFQGAVQLHPFRALAALSYEARKGRYPVEFWQTAMSNWPSNASLRLTWLFGRRLARLPNEIISGLSHYASDWCERHLSVLATSSVEDALSLWDDVVDRLFATGPEATSSSRGDVTIGGEPQNRSRKTYGHAINSPIGHMAETLFEILSKRKSEGGAKIPDAFRVRLGRLLSAPGEGADHAVSVTALRLRWLYYVDSDWTASRILPLFDPNCSQSEPAWSGYLHDNVVAGPELFARLKPHFLSVFNHAFDWRWDDSPLQKLGEFLVVACYWNLKDGRYVTYDEARVALQCSDDDARAHTVWFLGNLIRDRRCWRSYGKPFIEKAWPREKRFQTGSVSRSLASIAENAGKHFPDVVRTILPLLLPTDQLDMMLYRIKAKEGDQEYDLAIKYPESVLALLDRLVPEDPKRLPYDLTAVMGAIAESLPRLRQDERWRRLNRLVNRG